MPVDSFNKRPVSEPARNYGNEIAVFPLRFRNRRLERIFRTKWFRATRPANRNWKVASVATYIIITLMLVPASGPGIFEFQWFRLAVCLPLQVLGVIHAIAFKYNERSFHTIFLVTSFATYFNALYSFLFSDPSDAILYLYECALVYVFVHNYYPVRFQVILWFSAVSTSVAFVAFVIVDVSVQVAMLPLDMLLVGTIGMAVTCNSCCYLKEVLARRNFLEIRRARVMTRRAENLRRKALDATVAKSRFLAIAAHELRTPLNGINGFSELLRYMSRGHVSQSAIEKRFIEIEDVAREMSELVDHILEASLVQGEEDTVPETRFNILECLQAAARRSSNRRVRCGVETAGYRDAGQLLMQAHAGTLNIILDNLLALNRVPGSTDYRLSLIPESSPQGAWLILVTPRQGHSNNRSQTDQNDPTLPDSEEGNLRLTEALARKMDASIISFTDDDQHETKALRLPAHRLSLNPDDASDIRAGHAPDWRQPALIGGAGA